MKHCIGCGAELDESFEYDTCYWCGLTDTMEKDEDEWGDSQSQIWGNDE